MNDEELMRRISDALDAPGGLEGDADLRARLAQDDVASLYAADLQVIDSALAGLASGRPEPDWEAMLERIEHGLDGSVEGGGLEEIRDPTLAPVFPDDVAEDDVAEDDVAEDDVAEAPEVIVAPDIPDVSGAEVVDLSARRKRQRLFATIGGLAAAAAVGLGIMVGLQSADAPGGFGMQQEEAEMASAASSDLPAAEQPVPASAPVAPAPPSELAPEAEAVEQMAEVGVDRAGRLSHPARGRRPADSLRVFGVRGVGGTGAMAPDMPAPSPAAPVVARGRAAGSPAAEPPVVAQMVESPTRNPTRAEVVNALNVVASRVQRCIGTTGELARVHVRVDGASGRIVSTTVAPPYTGLQARCVVRAVRPVQMPRSQHPTYEVDHLYHPAPAAGGSLRPGRPATRQRRAPAATTGRAHESSVDSLSPPGD